MGTKWDEIEGLLQEAFDKDAWIHLASAVEKLMLIVRQLDERYGGCDQKAEWKLYSRCGDFVSYSCTAHLSLMVIAGTDYINALDLDADRDCCYRE